MRPGSYARPHAVAMLPADDHSAVTSSETGNEPDHPPNRHQHRGRRRARLERSHPRRRTLGVPAWLGVPGNQRRVQRSHESRRLSGRRGDEPHARFRSRNHSPGWDDSGYHQPWEPDCVSDAGRRRPVVRARSFGRVGGEAGRARGGCAGGYRWRRFTRDRERPVREGRPGGRGAEDHRQRPCRDRGDVRVRHGRELRRRVCGPSALDGRSARQGNGGRGNGPLCRLDRSVRRRRRNRGRDPDSGNPVRHREGGRQGSTSGRARKRLRDHRRGRRRAPGGR